MSALVPYKASLDQATGNVLLAPLQGLPFDLMVANGEGNRHAGDSKYYRLILIHALFAALAFLVFTPAAIICARFLTLGPKPRLAMFGHIGFQITSLVCLTITFISGYYAVGKANWGSNPHHIIGVIIYGTMLFQAFFGTFVRWRVNKKVRKAPPLHEMLHQWIGRAVFLLGLAQIPLGLYVYGSPKTLFILYAILAFLFLTSWFVLEYLKNRGWFHSRFGRPDGATPVPQMAERHDDFNEEEGGIERGYRPVGTEDSPYNTPKKPRLSKFSWLVRRSSQRNTGGTGNTVAIPYHYESTIDTSRAPSAQSPAMGGLAPAPVRKEEIPPVPSLPTNLGDRHGSGGSHQRYESLQDTALRDSTTLGPHPQRAPLQKPEPLIPHSPTQYPEPTPTFGTKPRSSVHGHQPYHSRTGQLERMPPSPNFGGGYIEAEEGFIPSPAESTPTRPLPLPPHRRERSTDSAGRLPISDSPDELPRDGQTVMIGGGEGSAGGQPHVAVQVKLNPDGKSVTVRRLPPDEAERERRERSRARQERALQREMEIDRERRATRHSDSGTRPRAESLERRATDDSNPPQTYTPSIGGQSSTIAGASGGLLGRSPGQHPPSISPLVGMGMHHIQGAVRSPPAALGGNSGNGGALEKSQRGSVTSASGTAENSEIEQEIVKEQRRRRRREEKMAQGGGGQLDPGGYYGPSGPDSQWT